VERAAGDAQVAAHTVAHMVTDTARGGCSRSVWTSRGSPPRLATCACQAVGGAILLHFPPSLSCTGDQVVTQPLERLV
jgi:hypothetical protein